MDKSIIDKLLGLIRNKRFDAVELDWPQATKRPDVSADELIGVLAELVAARQADMAEMLGWT